MGRVAGWTERADGAHRVDWAERENWTDWVNWENRTVRFGRTEQRERIGWPGRSGRRENGGQNTLGSAFLMRGVLSQADANME